MAPMKHSISPKIDHHSTRYFVYGVSSILLLFALLIGVMGVMVLRIRAQQSASTADTPVSPSSPYTAYFVAADSDGVSQVWGLTLPDGQSRILTHASQSVLHYALSTDYSQIAYVSDNQIWLQAIGQSNAEALTPVTPEAPYTALAFSPDGQSLAYANNGLWLLDLATRNSQELVTDVPITDETQDVAVLHYYSPLRFLDHDRILVHVAVWEGGYQGIFVLSSQTMQIISEFYNMLTLLPLQDNQYLAYSPTRRVGMDGFMLVESQENPIEPFTLTPFLSESFAKHQMSQVAISDVVEVGPGQIRFVGTSDAQTNISDQLFTPFIGTYDFNTRAFTIDMSPETLQLLEQVPWVHGMSADARYIAGYLNANWLQNELEYSIAIVDLQTHTPIELTVPSPVMYFEWADRK